MNIEQQVTSLELSKRLKELGVEQRGYFCWSVKDFETMEPKVVPLTGAVGILGKGVTCSAFTVAELGEMLPTFIVYEHTNEDKRWRCFSTKEVGTGSYPSLQYADTEADARAKMLIYLIENKLV